MPKPRYPHLQRELTRHKTWVWYVRIDRGPRIRIRGVYGSAEFMNQYHAAIAGRPVNSDEKKPEIGTLKWLVQAFMSSPEWSELAAETRKQLGYQFARMTEKSGHEKVTAFKNSDIVAARDSRKDKPSDANKFLKASRKIFEYAHRRNLITANPALGIPKIKEKLSGEGFHTWTEEECFKFEKCWPVGTRQRLAYDIFRFTGLRRGDAVRLGKQHVKDGEFTIKNQKTGREVTSTLLPPLLTSIAATTTGDLTFLVTAKGRPFDKWTFGNWFRAACVKAQVPGSAHGIRKASASAVAEGGATEAEMNSLFGWAHGSRESATYIEKASRKRMAKKASKLLFSRTSELGKGEINVKRLKPKDKV